MMTPEEIQECERIRRLLTRVICHESFTREAVAEAESDLRLLLGLDSEAELASLRAEIERLKEENAVLQSQVDNANANLEQVRLCMRSENDQLKAQVQLLNDRLSVARSAFSAAFPGKQLPTEQAKE